jgi:hypothetical protein
MRFRKHSAVLVLFLCVGSTCVATSVKKDPAVPEAISACYRDNQPSAGPAGTYSHILTGHNADGPTTNILVFDRTCVFEAKDQFEYYLYQAEVTTDWTEIAFGRALASAYHHNGRNDDAWRIKQRTDIVEQAYQVGTRAGNTAQCGTPESCGDWSDNASAAEMKAKISFLEQAGKDEFKAQLKADRNELKLYASEGAPPSTFQTIGTGAAQGLNQGLAANPALTKGVRESSQTAGSVSGACSWSSHFDRVSPIFQPKAKEELGSLNFSSIDEINRQIADYSNGLDQMRLSPGTYHLLVVTVPEHMEGGPPLGTAVAVTTAQQRHPQ